MKRETNLDQVSNDVFDICIIGAGASGAGCALDAALRGYKVLLVEQDDFAARTSSKSTKLIHGGVRYLEQAFKNLDFAQLTQVRHGLEERHRVLNNAPHLAKPLALITPVFSFIEGLYISIGLRLYGWFAAGKDNLPSSKWLSKKDTLKRIPTLNRKMHSAVLYYDGQLDDARYCLALAQSASEAGAKVINHAAITKFEHDLKGKLTGATLRDELSQEEYVIKAKLFLNCTGPAADRIRLKANPDLTERMRPSKGVHLLMPIEVLQSEEALLIPKTPDDRVVFAIPFQGYFMLGTTDTEEDNIDQEPQLTDQEVDYLLETAQPYFEQKLDRNQVTAGFGGLRPLIASDPSKSTRGLVRDHEVEHDHASGLLSLLGGKWTTYRLMAKDTIDYIAENLIANEQPCQTGEHLLVGAENYRADAWKQLSNKYQLEEDIAQHLNQHYGGRAEQVIALIQDDASLGQRLDESFPYVEAEVIFTAQEEMARNIRDFLARRIRLELLDWTKAKAIAPRVATLMGEALDWDASKVTEETRIYEAHIDALQQKALTV